MAISLTRAWTWTYTLGVESAIKQGRREEINSDLFEHFSYAGFSGEVTSTTNVAVLGRMLRGLPADIFWRLNLEGEPKMVSQSAIARAGGLLLLLIVGAVIGMMAFDFGIGSDEPYFSDDFPTFANDTDQHWPAFVFGGILAITSIIAAVAMLQTFRGFQTWLAGIGAVALVASSLCMVASVTAGLALVNIAEEWIVAGSVTGDGFWISAKHVAAIYESLGFMSVTFLILGLTAFGILIIWKAPLPRWAGMIGALSGLMLILSMVAEPFIGDASWGIVLLSAGFGLLWLVVTGTWLAVKGVYARPQQVQQVQ